MSSFVRFFSLYTMWGCIPCLAIIGIFFWVKQRTTESAILACGLLALAFGSLIQIFSPIAKITMDDAGNILSSSGTPLTWYIGSVLSSIGLIVTVVGFVIVTARIKGANNLSL